MSSKWYVVENEKEFGPFSGSQVKTMAMQGSLTRSSLVKDGHSGRVVKAGVIKGLDWPIQVPPITETKPEKNHQIDSINTFVSSKIQMAKSLLLNQRHVPKIIHFLPTMKNQTHSGLSPQNEAPNKWIAIALAWFMGPTGLHRFYVRNPGLGYLYLAVFTITFFYTFSLLWLAAFAFYNPIAAIDYLINEKIYSNLAYGAVIQIFMFFVVWVVNLFEVAKWLWTDEEDWLAEFSFKERKITAPSKVTAVLFAIFLGNFGAHKFYLGDEKSGSNILGIHVIAYAVFLLSLPISIISGAPLFGFVALAYGLVMLVVLFVVCVDIVAIIFMSKKQWENYYGY